MSIPEGKDYGVNCPQCGRRAFPTNFKPSMVGGSKYDNRTVWLCSDMGHCAFSIEEKPRELCGIEKAIRNIKGSYGKEETG